ncbi:MAG: MCE family protein [Actinomycetota bacterium]|nr:MCE family protein [Actinomycetota bacterium]
MTTVNRADRPWSRRPLTLVVLAVAAALVLSACKFNGAYDLPLPGGNSVNKADGYTITADFADVLNVVPRSPVMVSDVPVGQVIDVERNGWHARITMRIRKNIVLPDNAIADIRQTSLLGEKYVALVKPAHDSGRRLGDGDNIPLASTGRNPEVEEVLGALSFLLSGGGVAQLKTISTEANKIMSGRTDKIRHLLGNLDSLIGNLNQQKGDIVAAMDSIDRLATTLNNEKHTVTAAIDAIGPAVTVLNQQHKSLIAMLTQLDRLGKVGTRVINASRANLVATLRQLAPTLRKLADAGDSLPKGLSLLVSFPFPKEAADIVKGDYANALFNVTFDLRTMAPKPAAAPNRGLPTGLPGPLVDACIAVKKQVTAAADSVVKHLPLSNAQKQKLSKAIVARVMASIDCRHPGNIPRKVALALLAILKSGAPGLHLPPLPLPTLPPLPVVPGIPGLGLRSSWVGSSYANGNATTGGGLLGSGLG